MFRAPQEDSESDDERDPTTQPSSTNQKSRFNYGAFGRPPLKTPFRSNYATASLGSSSSSSSTTSIIFDEELTRAGTPFTPPISETPDSSNANRSRLSSHGKLSTTSFVERCVDTNGTPSATPTPATTSTAKDPQYLSESESELLVEGTKKLSVQDDEQASNAWGGLCLDKSPAPVGRPHLKKRGRQSMQGDDDHFQSPTNNGLSNRKNKPRNTSRTDETPPTEPKVKHSLNLARDTSHSRKRKGSEAPSLVIAQADSEGEGVDADSSGAIAQNLPHPGQYQGQQATLSAPRASHRRSKSASGPHDTNSFITQDTPTASTSLKNASPTQTNEIHASLLHPASASKAKSKRQTSRRRSTGSLVPEDTVLPPIEFPSPGDDERVPGAFPIVPINFSEASRQSPSSEPPERMPDLHPDETRKSPKLAHMYPTKMKANDLKNEILRLIRRQKAKPAALSTLKHGYVYIFKLDRFPGYVKIGSTINAPDVRMKEWGTSCKFNPIHVTDNNDKAFRFCRIVEQIVHAELYNERRIFHCDRCPQKHIFKMGEREKGAGENEDDVRPTAHGEWFEISETKALEVVNKWRDWMIHQEPYKQDATLLSCWVWKYEMGTKRMKGTEREWEVWRRFGWRDKFWLILYDLNKWLGEVSPLLQKLVNSRGSAFVLAAGVYLMTVGVNLTSCLKVAMVLLLYRFICFKFC
jgi:hypothetical protein